MQHAFGEEGQIGHGSENTGLSCDTAHYISVFVVDFALNDSLAKRPVIFGRRDCGFHSAGGRNRVCVIPKGGEDLLSREQIECQPGLPREHFSQEDEPDVAILGARAGGGDQARGERSANQFLARLQQTQTVSRRQAARWNAPAAYEW